MKKEPTPIKTVRSVENDQRLTSEEPLDQEHPPPTSVAKYTSHLKQPNSEESGDHIGLISAQTVDRHTKVVDHPESREAYR